MRQAQEEKAEDSTYYQEKIKEAAEDMEDVSLLERAYSYIAHLLAWEKNKKP